MKQINGMNELKEIERLASLNDGYEQFDPWGDDTRGVLYLFLVNEFKRKRNNYFSGENDNYLVYYRSGRNGRGGMDIGSPDTMYVAKVNEYRYVRY